MGALFNSEWERSRGIANYCKQRPVEIETDLNIFGCRQDFGHCCHLVLITDCSKNN